MNRKSASMSDQLQCNDLGNDTLLELARRLQEIDDGYRGLAEKVGQLYMYADRQHFDSLTRRLDEPMRHASLNEQAFSALLDDLRLLQRRQS